MRRAPLTDAAIRGLIRFLTLAKADVESDPNAWTEEEHREMDAADRWLTGALQKKLRAGRDPLRMGDRSKKDVPRV